MNKPNFFLKFYFSKKIPYLKNLVFKIKCSSLLKESFTLFESCVVWYAPAPANAPNAKPAAKDGTLPEKKTKALFYQYVKL